MVHGVVVGDGVDYMTLYMVDGEIRLDLRIGTGRLKTGVSKKRYSTLTNKIFHF